MISAPVAHTAPAEAGGYSHSLLTENVYDGRGRLTTTLRSLEGQILSPVYCFYDELGRLIRKEIGDGPDNVGNIAFSYDIHGWTTGIEARNNWGQDLVFRETLRYASPSRGGSVARFDGNISEITFTAGGGGAVPSGDTYGYAYDGLKRLTDAAHYAGNSTSATNTKTERSIIYDRNGNITGLDRYGASGLSGMLSFAHTGNRLTSLQCWDGENLPGIALLTFDQIGNLLTDSRKGLQFSYNL